MTRVANADEFLIEFRQARRRYEKESKGWVQKLVEKYDPRVGVGEDDAALIEEHVCSYLVTRFLHALNWNRSSAWNEPLFVENMLREAPVRSQAEQPRRRMDYLGFDRADLAPLLLLEAKAPGYGLPNVRYRRPSYLPNDRLEEIAEIIGRGLRGGAIAKHWQDWLASTTDYVKACREQTGVAPKRVVIMNDRWMVIFINPVLCFDSLDECGRQDIRVYENLDNVEAEFVNVFHLLEHGQVLGPQKVQTIEKEALCVYLKPGDLRYALRGLLVNYDEVSRNDAYGPRPCIEVKPLLFLQTTSGSWFRLEAKEPHRIPIKMPALSDHLADVRAASDALVTAVKSFDFAVEVKDITFHYKTLLKELPGVREVPGSDGEQFELVLGLEPHYIAPVSTPQCPFHEPINCGVAIANPAVRRRMTSSPRSFFIAGETHHCAHQTPHMMRSLPIIEQSDVPRSRSAGQAFCEIYPFEQRLCCRACAFEDVCKQSKRFDAYPCGKP